MPRVFVVQQHIRRDRENGTLVPHNYSSAESFGSLEYLVPVRQVVEEEWGGDVEKLLLEKLKTFDQADYLLPSGDPILCSQAVLAAVTYLDTGQKLRMLKWDRRANTYQECLINIPF